ncbi:DedA family protein [Paenibacillus sp. GCM10027626]|uniref:DedA family protein n=1 Tax=Paenibacillus sp. GCM10027626 TaxID=3273411 RepID=UPI00363CC656
MEQNLSELISRYGYWGIFAALSLGIIGLPIPDEVLMTYVGYNVFQGTLNYPLAIVSAFIGASTGITISYSIGKKLGLPFLHKYGPKFHITEKRIQRTQTLFEKYGNFLLFIGFFIPGVRHLTAYVAGISNLQIRKFMLIAYSGALVWCVTLITLGHTLGEKWFLVSTYLHRYSLYLIGVSIFIAVAIIGYLSLRKSKITS